MSTDEIIDILESIDDQLLIADGFNDAIIGYVEGGSRNTVVLYDTQKVIDILMKRGMSEEDAIEYFEYNILGAYMGKNTPYYATILRN